MLSVLIKGDEVVEITVKTNSTIELKRAIRLLNGFSSVIADEKNADSAKEYTLFLCDAGNKTECGVVMRSNLSLTSLEIEDIINEVAIEPKQEKAKIVASTNYDHLIWLKNEIERTGAKCSIE